MGVKGVFEEPPDNAGPVVVISDAPELVLVDKVLRTSYDVVKELVGHLDDVEGLNQSIYNIHYIIPVLDEITFTAGEGLAGGGLMTTSPEFNLDLSTLTSLSGSIDLTQDLVAVHDASEELTRSVPVSTFKTSILARMTTLLGADVDALHLGLFTGEVVNPNRTVKAAIQEVATYVEVGLVNANQALDDGLASAVSNLTGLIDDVAADLSALTSSTSGSIGGLNSSMSIVNGSVSGLLDDVANIFISLTNLGDIATVQENDITALEVELVNKATVVAVEDLDVRITENAGILAAQAVQIDLLTVTVEEAAVGTALEALTVRVTDNEGAIDSQASSLTYLNAAVLLKADASALDTLTARVTVNEDDITAQAASLLALTAVVDDKAEASALDALSAEVSVIDGEVTAVATAITNLSAGSTPGNTASARIQMSAVSAPSGWDARYSIEVKGGDAGTFESAGFYMDANEAGGSRVAIQADQFIVDDGVSGTAPFVVSGGDVFMGNVDISNAIIGTLLVDTINLTNGALAGSAYMFHRYKEIVSKDGSLNWSGNTNGTRYSETLTLDSVEVNNLNPAPVLIVADLKMDLIISGNTPSGGEGSYLAVGFFFLDRKPPSGSWKTFKTFKVSKTFGKNKHVKKLHIRENVAFNHMVSGGSSGKWQYRVRTKVIHKRGDNNWSRFDVKAMAKLNMLWSKR